MTHEQYTNQKERYLKYLQMKVEQQDWHGVADCAMDLRDLDNYYRGYTESTASKNPAS